MWFQEVIVMRRREVYTMRKSALQVVWRITKGTVVGKELCPQRGNMDSQVKRWLPFTSLGLAVVQSCGILSARISLVELDWLQMDP